MTTQMDEQSALPQRPLIAGEAQPAQDPERDFPNGMTPTFAPSLLLLADSALPLGSFAFSSGLESYLAHQAQASAQTSAPTTSQHSKPPSSQSQISTFLHLSLHSVSSSMLPYLLAAYSQPAQLRTLDNDLDASISCTVARRSSIAQGRALLAVWEKAFRQGFADEISDTLADAAVEALAVFSTSLKLKPSFGRPAANGHLAPLFALVSRSQGLSRGDTAWVFLFNHARAVLSAAVRAGAMGPYQSQAVLASPWLRELLGQCVRRGDGGVLDAGQSVPVLDVWSGRHEKLYSRIFNS